MSDGIFVAGKKYISANDAARLADVTRDYIGRLCRDGEIIGKRVGKPWFIEEESLQDYIIKSRYEREKRFQKLVEGRVAEYAASRNTKSPLDGIFRSAAKRGSVPNASLGEKSAKENVSSVTAFAAHAQHHALNLAGKFHIYTKNSPVTFSALAHVSPNVSHTATDIVHRIATLVGVFALVFGAYALVDARYAQFATQSFSDARIAASQVPARIASALSDENARQLTRQFALVVKGDIAGASAAATENAGRTLAGIVYRVTNGALAWLVYGIEGRKQARVEVEIVSVNGISGFFATNVYAENVYASEVHSGLLCVGAVCVTEAEFLNMVSGVGASQGNTPLSGGGVGETTLQQMD